MHSLWCLMAMALVASCNLGSPPAEPEDVQPHGYRIHQPDTVITLSDSLREISDLAWAGGDTLLAVQDELGILFYVDGNTGRILRKRPFGGAGDYEGVAVAGDTVYVLRSDGVIFELAADTVLQYETGIPAKNNEGFCHHPEGHRLLIGPTSRPGKEPLLAAAKQVFAFDLHSHTLQEEPVITCNLDLLHDYAAAQDLKLPEHKGKKNKLKSFSEIRFKISAIAVYPHGQNLWMLSADDGMLFGFEWDGSITGMENLDADLYPKPEGMCWTDHSLFISNEGVDGGKATLVRINHSDKGH